MVVVGALGLSSLTPASRTEAAPPSPSTGKSANSALGNGLGRLVEQASGATSKRSAGGLQINQDALAIRDGDGRVLVDLTPQAGVDRQVYRRRATALGLRVQSVDTKRGTLEGFIALEAVAALAALPGTGTLAQALRPAAHIGAATSQGVALQRIDRAHGKGASGKGITIGALSDSYDTATVAGSGGPLTIHAAQDVRSGDLPGVGNKKYPQPVVVVEDATGGNDEGRAMLQIAHDVAPAAKLCFATAFTGLVGFADNIRKLADKSGRCGADVVVDDVAYFDEPMFSDSVLSDAIDEVAAKGTHYFSSAGNDGVQGAWQSRARLIPAARAVRGTNLDLTGVDPALYTGGLQDMKPGRGVDVAQDLAIGPDGGLFDLQWDDPVDLDGSTFGASYFSGRGSITAANPLSSFAFTPTASQVGQTVQFRTDAIPSGTTDLILTVTAPDGTPLGTVDTGSSPEVLSTQLAQAGTYTITVSGFNGDTGDFTVDVRPVLSPSKVTTDYNALLFAENGAFLGAIADSNTFSGRPSEIAFLTGIPKVQLVISRSGTGPVGATRLRNVLSGDIYFSEYARPLAPAIFGHPSAKGATAVAAYDPFKPYLPESFTSPGGHLPVFFDSAGNRYRKPSVRSVPQVAAADGGNTTFFYKDTVRDADTQPNFFGTSASAPHAAAITALALQKAGGPKSLSPAKMRKRLQLSAFAHDLDPGHAAGRAHGLTISADGPQGSEASSVPGAMSDPRFFRLHYAGKVPLKSVTFYGESASPTALGSTRTAPSGGIVFDPRPFDAVPPFETDGFPFTVGSTAGGLVKSSVKAKFSVPFGSYAGQYRHLTISFGRGIKKGQSVRFGVDRDLAVSGLGASNEGNSADELGGSTFLPSGHRVPGGMKFVAVRTDGKKFTGIMKNRLGKGFSPLDGYGLVNAERAVR